MYWIQQYVIKFVSRSVVFSTNKADCHDITEILLKVVLNTNIVLGGLIIILPFNKITFVFFHRKRKYGQQTR
jgi:hypothetical protein